MWPTYSSSTRYLKQQINKAGGTSYISETKITSFLQVHNAAKMPSWTETTCPVPILTKNQTKVQATAYWKRRRDSWNTGHTKIISCTEAFSSIETLGITMNVLKYNNMHLCLVEDRHQGNRSRHHAMAMCVAYSIQYYLQWWSRQHKTESSWCKWVFSSQTKPQNLPYKDGHLQ